MSWLLLPAVLGLAVAATGLRPRLPLDRRGQALALWGGWLVVAGGYFSVVGLQGLAHRTQTTFDLPAEVHDLPDQPV